MPLLPPPVLPELGTVMYIWGWDGQGVVPLWGSAGLRGGPGPAPRAVNVFRAGGGRWSLLFQGEGWAGPPTWPLGSVVFYTCALPKGLGKVVGGGGEGEGGHAVDTGISSPSSRKRAPNSVTYCVPTYLFVVNI